MELCGVSRTGEEGERTREGGERENGSGDRCFWPWFDLLRARCAVRWRGRLKEGADGDDDDEVLWMFMETGRYDGNLLDSAGTVTCGCGTDGTRGP